MDLTVWPDAELIVIDYFTEVLDGVWSCNSLPPVEEFNARLPIIDVTRIGGLRTADTWSDGYLIDEPTIDLDIWAATPESGATTAARSVAALAAMRGYRAHGAAAGRVKDITGPRPRPEVSQNIIRLGVTATLPLRLT
ncbi:hypothetical protein [Actinomadura violacea]|uniref:Uncharacterized protein n=1 Tax=Actinomadura violacea TaxID=2819934 RepID=A0ABS3RWQ0_9ACTN|nr:hypothetical protein [Actinomadura violacea]MBO2461186.1 hypothetical protein [Actinomadura violacea]